MRTVCPKCKGKGWFTVREGHHWWFAPFTLGISLFGDKYACNVCDEEGYLEE